MALNVLNIKPFEKFLANRPIFVYTGMRGDKMGVGRNLKEILRDKKMTIKQLSEQANIPLNTLYSITKRDSKRVDDIILRRIATALGVSYFDLISKEERAIYEKGYKEGSEAEEWQNHVIDELWKQEGYSYSDTEVRLINSFSQLNDAGQKKAVDAVEIIAGNPDYQRSQQTQSAPESPPPAREVRIPPHSQTAHSGPRRAKNGPIRKAPFIHPQRYTGQKHTICRFAHCP